MRLPLIILVAQNTYPGIEALGACVRSCVCVCVCANAVDGYCGHRLGIQSYQSFRLSCMDWFDIHHIFVIIAIISLCVSLFFHLPPSS